MENRGINKKIYTKPELEVVKVDHEISLVMMSEPFNPNPSPAEPEAAMLKSSPLNESTNPVTLYQPTSQQDVFGGDAVDF